MEQITALEPGWVLEERETIREVAYEIRDALFGTFEVLRVATAGRPGWWEGDSGKLDKLIDAFKAGHTIKDALFWAGISWDQWYAFTDAHPQFALIKEACESYQTYGLMNAFNIQAKQDGRLAFSALRTYHPKFKRTEPKVAAPVVQQTVVTVSTDVDTTKIEALLAAEAEQFITHGGSEGGDDEGGGHSVEEHSALAGA